ncbi:MAG: DegT/DnrJ/EryC1/StrS family aminotransferase, partial [SAR202 cluster bacterium]|nr:DegT/DnrJ/EryC1/StrS family aminotransferase [SAR202 cluster bacterium]
IKKAITKKTRAIMPVHWGGASPEIEKIIEIANNFQLEIIEDACMGIGAKINNKSPGTFGKLGAFSMHPLKSLNVMGDGGMVVTDDNHLASWIKKYRNHGMIDRDNIDLWGVNMRLQPLQAVVAYFGLNKIEEVIKIRNKNAKILDNELCKLAPYVKVPQRLENYIETFALYMILCDERDELVKYLNSKKIEVKIHYPLPLHLQKASSNLGYKAGDFPIAEEQSSKLVTLPVHQYLSENQINFMIENIFAFYG